MTEFVDKVKESGRNSYLASVDISRAYKNFRSDPLDWPLLCGYWDNAYYCDVTLPFGARASSYHMQSIANAIRDILEENNICVRIYLDDIVILSPDKKTAIRDYNVVKNLLKRLGLPEAEAKSQPPARAVEWLGVLINTADMTLSIPSKKVDETMRAVKKCTAKKVIKKKDLQSIIGRLIHVAKCVAPARLFVSRLLEALRNVVGTSTPVTDEMRADFAWFTSFCRDWNGIAMIQRSLPDRRITVDASLTGIGGHDGKMAYAAQVCGDHQIAKNISELEAVNIAVALHTFIKPEDAGSHIRIACDNLSSVQIMQTGRGRNKIMLDVARYIWMIQAKFDIDISYEHIQGVHNQIADALSRAHLSPKFANRANKYIFDNDLTTVKPCLYMFNVLKYDLFL